VIVVRVDELGVERGGEALPDDRLARAGDAHYDDDHGFLSEAVHGFYGCP